MALTEEELQRIANIETSLNKIQTFITGLVDKPTLRKLSVVRQKEISDLQSAIQTSSGLLSGNQLSLKKQVDSPALAVDYGILYAYDDGGGITELYAQDSAGNNTQISPHNDQGEWEFYSRNSITGKTVRINMEEMIRDIEQLTGKSYIKDS